MTTSAARRVLHAALQAELFAARAEASGLREALRASEPGKDLAAVRSAEREACARVVDLESAEARRLEHIIAVEHLDKAAIAIRGRS